MRPARRWTASHGARIRTLALGISTVALVAASPPSAGARVLRVGRFNGTPGNVQSIQSAVDTAQPGDWVLIGPGDYHPRADYSAAHHAPADESGAGVLVQTNGVHIRGMNRNHVVIDGTQPGSSPCSSNPQDQTYGPPGQG